MRVSKNCPGEYRKGSNLFEYRKMVDSGRVPGKGRIRAITEKESKPVSKNGRISVRTENPLANWPVISNVLLNSIQTRVFFRT